MNTLPLKEEFLLNIQINNYSPETVYNYERDLSVFEDFLNSEIKTDFRKVTKKDLLLYKAYLASIDRLTPLRQKGNKRLSSFSLNHALSALRSYLKFLIDMDFVSPIAPNSVTLIKTERRHTQIAEMPEFIKLIEFPTKIEKNKIIGLRNRAMLETLFATGMRISELLSLKRSQIDHTGRIFITGKGKKQRFVYLTPRAMWIIKEYLKTRKDTFAALFVPYRGRNSGEKDKHISCNYLQYKIKKYRELLKINLPVSAHSLRHAFATYLAEEGANPAALQHLLGHESLTTTTRYVHASDRYAEETHRKFHPLKD
ncbi:MAG: tyrosine-type recombinase/integrase [Candidatus Magasanikbacteria bacterium]|nr:tyrosine-type recombinase/integrase [Candidatus Magasanikbacteria bacterium]